MGTARWLRNSENPVERNLDAGKQRALTGELLELVARFNRAQDRSMVVDAEYLEVLIVRR